MGEYSSDKADTKDRNLHGVPYTVQFSAYTAILIKCKRSLTANSYALESIWEWSLIVDQVAAGSNLRRGRHTNTYIQQAPL